MGTLRIAQITGGWKTLDTSVVTSFQSSIRGALLTEADPGYDQARSIWNAMIDKRPALIAQCSGAADVRKSVNFARENGLLTAIRGGGHNIAGSALCDGGLVIDLSKMRTVHVDPRARRAFVSGGATLGDFDHEAQAFGLATALGINSTTGVARVDARRWFRLAEPQARDDGGQSRGRRRRDGRR